MNRTTAHCATALLLVSSALAAHAGDAPTVSGAWARATPPGIGVGAAYLLITGGDRADRFVGASTPRAAMVEMHEVIEADGVSRMRPIEAIPIPARTMVTLAPKGLHLMLMGLEAPLVAGQTFPITLQFAESAAQTVTVVVRAAADDGSHDQH